MQKSVEFLNTTMQIPVFIRKTIEVIIDKKHVRNIFIIEAFCCFISRKST